MSQSQLLEVGAPFMIFRTRPDAVVKVDVDEQRSWREKMAPCDG